MKYDTYLDNRDPSLADTDTEHFKEVVYTIRELINDVLALEFLANVIKLLPRFSHSHLPPADKFQSSLKEALECEEYDVNSFFNLLAGRI